MAEVLQRSVASENKVLGHACSYCKTSFASKNKLFAHLRNSNCTVQAASNGLKVTAQQEKVALIIGCSNTTANWHLLLWQAIDVARGVGTLPGRESYAERGGAPGAAFAVDPSDLSVGPRVCDVLGFITEALTSDSDEMRREWCATANQHLPDCIRILGRSAGLPMEFHADRSCIRRNYNCVLPTQLLIVKSGEAAAEWGSPTGDEQVQEADAELPQVDSHCRDASIFAPSIWKRKHSRREHDPGWGDGEEGEALLGQFFRVKEILRRLTGEHRFHNFSSASKLCPGDSAARRFVYRCKALPSAGHDVTALTFSVDALLLGQIRAMAGLTVAIQQGLLPADYLEAAFSEDRLVPVPMIPDGTQYLAGCVFHKSVHYLLQPLMEGAEAQAWKQQVELSVTQHACSGIFEAWYLEQLLPMLPTMLGATTKDTGALNLSFDSCSRHSVPEVYADVLCLLREAENSGKWPGISKGREKVIKDSTLAENGGGGGSFTVGSMPPPLEPPSGNIMFPELALRAFELERALKPDRTPSSTIAINKKAQFVPHVDSGAGAGQGVSLIVGLGEYSGGELAVEGAVHDIRYKPLEFNGWTQRHWTLPFEGERYSLVWFTPVGCEDMPGLKVCGRSNVDGSAGSDSREAPPEDSAVKDQQAQQASAATGATRVGLLENSASATWVRLRNGVMLPRLGLGTFQLSGSTAETAMAAALNSGYRLFDTASQYKNEDAIGRAMHSWEEEQKASGSCVFATVKCSPKDMGFEAAQDACKASLQRLGRKCIDLYLIHWPAMPKKPHSSPEHRRARRETWRAFEVLYKSGLVRAIGVSNFTVEHLRQLLEDGVEEIPMINQIEVHPFYVPIDTLNFCKEHGIVVQAYAPLGGGPWSNAAKATGGEADGTRMLLGHSSVRQISEEVSRSPAQVVLRWCLQKHLAVIPRSSNPARVVENSQIFDFSLTDSQMSQLDALREDVEAQKFCWNSSTVS